MNDTALVFCIWECRTDSPFLGVPERKYKSPGTEKMDQKTESRKEISKRAFPLVKDRTREEEKKKERG